MTFATTFQTNLDSFLFVNFLANVGINKGVARCLMSLIFNYQLAFFERWIFGTKKLHQKVNSRLPQHVYHILCSVVLMSWNCADDSKHMLYCILAQYLIIKVGIVLNLRKIALVVTWVFQMGYYLNGIFSGGNEDSTDYGFTWTTPQCVLVLRCIMLATDVYDGGKDVKLLKWDQKESSLKDSPGFIESIAYMSYYGAVLIGPQFTLSHYKTLEIVKCVINLFSKEKKRFFEFFILIEN